MYALREGLARLVDVGLEESWSTHKKCAEMLHEGLEKLGLELLVKDKVIFKPLECSGFKFLSNILV